MKLRWYHSTSIYVAVYQSWQAVHFSWCLSSMSLFLEVKPVFRTKGQRELLSGHEWTAFLGPASLSVPLSSGSPGTSEYTCREHCGEHLAVTRMLRNSAHCPSENHEKQSSLLTETYKLVFAGLTDYSVPKYNYVGLEVETPFLTLTDLRYTDDFPLN